MIFNSRIGQIGDRMQLISPLMTISQSTQLQFSYYISHSQPHGGSLLQLFQVSKLGIRVKLLFDNSMSVDTTWQLATVCLPPGSYSLVFQGTMGNPVVSDIAIDSIRVTMNNQCLVVSGPTTKNKNGKCEIVRPRLYEFLFTCDVVTRPGLKLIPNELFPDLPRHYYNSFPKYVFLLWHQVIIVIVSAELL